MSGKAKPLVVFIEDTPSHYEAIKKHLGACRCQYYGPKDLAGLKERSRDNVPEVLAVDEMLFSSAAVERDFDKGVRRTTGQIRTGMPAPRTPRPRPRPSGASMPYKSGIECAADLKKEWPTMRVLLFTRLAKDAAPTMGLWYEVIGKKLGPGNVLKNGDEIAARIRAMLRDHSAV